VNRISRHDTAVFEMLQPAGVNRITGSGVARADGVAKRTARVTRFLRMGLVERLRHTSGPPLPALDPRANEKCPEYLARLRQAP
jgi:hypothetical protein